MKLPAALEPYRQQFEKSRLPYIKILPQPSRSVPLWQSKVGGAPYLPKGQSLPTDPAGRELFFLAQINFSEAPHLPPFPSSGLLQFFISDSQLLGMETEFDEQHEQDFFRVIFYPEVFTDPTYFDTKQQHLQPVVYLPHEVEREYPLLFAADNEIAPVSDYRFYQIFGQDFFGQFGKEEWKIYEAFEKEHRTDGHKIGGYAFFTQDDPRNPADPMLLLLQLDSDESMNLMWGDTGVAHFFIREADLVARRFDQTKFSWDCL